MPGVTSPITLTAYSLSTIELGCASLLASSPSVVNSNNPLVLISSLPMETQRPCLSGGSLSNTDGLPSGSLREQISSSGLL